MPEDREEKAHAEAAQHSFEELKANDCDFSLLNIWFDGSKDDATAAPKSSRLRQGLVSILESTSKVKRGSRMAQTYVFPHMFAPPPKQSGKKSLACLPSPPPPLSTLILEDMLPAARSILLKFNHAYCQVSPWLHFHSLLSLTFIGFGKIQYLTHTSIQIYTRSQWENSISRVDKTVGTLH